MAKQHANQPESTEHKVYDGRAAAEWIPEIVQRIVNGFDPEQIILFGSHASGEATRWSDIDLLVVFSEPVDKRQTAVDIRMLLRDLPVPKDIIVTDRDEINRRGHLIGTVLRPALSEGKVIYERD